MEIKKFFNSLKRAAIGLSVRITLFAVTKQSNMIQIIPTFLKELQLEATTTRKMLALVPEDKYDWKPHEKSMTLKQLVGHIAEIPGWIPMGLATEGIDFSGGYQPPVFNDNKELMALLESNLAAAQTALETTNDEALEKYWTMRSGDTIHMSLTKAELTRHAFSQLIHHRAQLGVNLRLLNIAIPGSYGPSADDTKF
jgi:uncharacterized damage-inducible protein DinB